MEAEFKHQLEDMRCQHQQQYPPQQGYGQPVQSGFPQQPGYGQPVQPQPTCPQQTSYPQQPSYGQPMPSGYPQSNYGPGGSGPGNPDYRGNPPRPVGEAAAATFRRVRDAMP